MTIPKIPINITIWSDTIWTSMKSLEVEGSPCDAASYDVDDVFLERLERAMQGLETLALEQNDTWR